MLDNYIKKIENLITPTYYDRIITRRKYYQKAIILMKKI
jgi:hypothetical protein